jgi:dTDP-glucose pyrophosphorylase
MEKLQVVMPMAGLGERFSKAGFLLPKPLILVDEKPMFLKALESIQSLMNDVDLTIVLRKEMDDKWNLSKNICAFFPKTRINLVEEPTKGAAETVSLALGNLPANASMLVMDCDIHFSSEEFLLSIQNREHFKYDGALIFFKSNDPRYSYVKEESLIATKVVEKEVISNNAIVGAYFFKNVKSFQYYFDQAVRGRIGKVQSEFYISDVVQAAILDGQLFRIFPAIFDSFGTPEELESYNNRFR